MLLGEAFNFCAILDDYNRHEKIGEGGFGQVYLATSKNDKKQYAIKFMDMTQTCKLLHFSNMVKIAVLFARTNNCDHFRDSLIKATNLIICECLSGHL